MSVKEIQERGHYCQSCNAKCGKPNLTYITRRDSARKQKKALDKYYEDLYGKNEAELLQEAREFMRSIDLDAIHLSDGKTTLDTMREVV